VKWDGHAYFHVLFRPFVFFTSDGETAELRISKYGPDLDREAGETSHREPRDCNGWG
jgi:hypothetical protein